MTDARWPELDYLSWRETCAALHLYLQVGGKYRLAHTPWINHSWHATFLVGARGLTTTLVPDGPGVEVLFDLVDHKVIAESGDGRRAEMALRPTTVAAFHAEFRDLIAAVGGRPDFHGSPNEVADPVPFAEDHRDRPYDAEAVTRFFRALAAADRVFKAFRTSFIGKASPVHLFWGSFDLAATRFSGRAAPLHPGGVPALPDDVAQEAYDQEVSSAGFWPGGSGGVDYPAFYAYAYPAPQGYAQAGVQPDAAFWHKDLGEFVLPYAAVRESADPDAALLGFLETTYAAAADLARWDRSILECRPGAPRRPRPLHEAPEAGGGLAPAPAGASPDITYEEGPAKGRYLARLDGHEAEMTVSRAGERLLIIDHTEVPDALRGRRVGEALVRRAVENARETGRSILPLCPFARAQFARHAEWQDVLRR